MTRLSDHPPAEPSLASPDADGSPRADAGSRRRRILVVAFATSPYRGSEPGGGWNVVRHLADHHDVTVLSFPGFEHDARQLYQRYIQEHGPLPGLTMAWVEQPPLSRLLQREGLWQRAFYYRGYRSWEKAAYAKAVQLHRQQPFDLAYRLNMTGFREPGYLWKLDLPYAWGPIAGAVMMPRAFFPLLSPHDRVFYGVRNLLNARQMKSIKRCRLAAQKASQLWAVDELNRAMIRDHFGSESDILLDSGCEPKASAQVRRYEGAPRDRVGGGAEGGAAGGRGRPLEIIWSGVHEGRKCLPILLHALARLRETPPGDTAANDWFRLKVLADGPETANWQALAARLGLAEAVTWTGMLPHGEAVAAMDHADVFVLTSLQEAATHVVMEALASGLPVLCHDACGMAVAIDERCGIKVPLIDPQTSIDGFAAALQELIDRPERVEALSAGALRRAEELSWSEKAREIAGAFDRVLATADAAGAKHVAGGE